MARELKAVVPGTPIVVSAVSSPREQIERVGELLADPNSSLDETCRESDRLYESVQQHFFQENREEVFREIVFNAPWLTPQSECLREQAESLKRLAESLRQAAASAQSDGWRDDLSGRFEHFAETFFEHEASVRDLIRAQNEESSEWPAF